MIVPWLSSVVGRDFGGARLCFGFTLAWRDADVLGGEVIDRASPPLGKGCSKIGRSLRLSALRMSLHLGNTRCPEIFLSEGDGPTRPRESPNRRVSGV